MSVVAITASRTSPGATVLASGLALAWSHMADRALLVEADPAGGVLALRFELAAAPSLTTLGSDVRNSYSHGLIWENTQDLRGVHCIPAPVDPRLARSWIERLVPSLTENLPKLGAPTVIDLGWVDEDGPSAPLAVAADTTLVVTSPEIAEVQSLLYQVRRLEAHGANVALVTIGNTPNDPQEIAAIAGVPLAAVLPHDPKVAAALTGQKFAPKKFQRSLLWRTINGLADALLDQALMNSRAAASVAADNEEDMIEVAEMHQAVEMPPAIVIGASPQAGESSEEALVGVGAPIVAASASDDDNHFWQRKGVEADDSFAFPKVDESAWAPGPLEDLAPTPVVDRFNPPPYNPVPVAAEPAAPVVSPTPEAAEPQASIVIGEPIVPNIEPVDVTLVGTAPTPDASPAVEPTAFLVFDDGTRQELSGDAALIVGRHRTCDIVLDDSQVSRQHGRFTKTGEGWHYTDLGSRNGSSINAIQCVDTDLTPGDSLSIGRVQLSFEALPTRPTRNEEF